MTSEKKARPEDGPTRRMTNELCFSCDNACGGCSWSREFKPVPGWTAEPSLIWVGDRQMDSYHITDCPEFAADKPLMEMTKDSIDFDKMGQALRLLRSALGLSLKKFSHKVEIEPGILGKIETGRGALCAVETLRRVADACGFDQTDFARDGDKED